MADSPKIRESLVIHIERFRKYLTDLINDAEGDVKGTRILAQPGSDVMGALSNWLHDVAQPNSGVNPDFLPLSGITHNPGFSLFFRPGSRFRHAPIFARRGAWPVAR